jgi:hypothetical protein
MATWAARSALALAALVQQRVYPRRIWRATFCLTGHVANREQQFGLRSRSPRCRAWVEPRSGQPSRHFTPAPGRPSTGAHRPVKWVTITPDWAALTSLRRSIKRPPHQTVTSTPSEVDMHTTISGRHVAHQTVAALWIIAGIFAVIVLADAFALLALAIVITAWWILSAVEHHIERRQWGSPGAGHETSERHLACVSTYSFLAPHQLILSSAPNGRSFCAGRGPVWAVRRHG